MKSAVFSALLCLFATLPRLAFAAPALFITEFMADNSRTLEDEDQEFPDWVEIFNPNDAEVNLDGYYLTDKSDEPTQWRFPAVKLGPRQFMTVFCSGNDLRDPALPLHTNFKLNNDGEQLRLVAPDGVTILSQYNGYPEQQPDVSYGMAINSTYASPVVAGAASRVLVPSSADLGLLWTQPGFNDATWRQGTTAIGYGVRSPELELVGTDVTAEMKGVNASIYIRVPFQIADPTVIDVLKLRVRYDDGFIAYLNGELVATGNAPAALDWNSASSKSHLPRDYEVFDISSHVKALTAGLNVLAIQGLNASADNTDFFILPALDTVDIGEVQPNVLQFFPQPTPGAPNSPGFETAGPRPIFSLASGTYVDTRMLEVTTDVPGAVVRYTIDGTVPQETSTAYAAPIEIKGPTQVSARVFKDGWAPGIPERNTYIIVDPAAAALNTNLPIVLVTTFGRPIGTNCGGGAYTNGFFSVVEPGQDGEAALGEDATFSSGAAFRRRGSSTCGFTKFAFNVELEDPEGRDSPAKVLDFPKEADFIMFGGNNFDRTLMHNPLAYWMSLECGRWAARSRFVECYYHPGKGPVTASSYFGIYAFMEKNKRDVNRVDISSIHARDNAEPEVTGGYILRRDRVGQDEIAISAAPYSSLVFVYPKLPSLQQRAYMSKALTTVFASLNPNVGSQEDNPLIDFTAWIDHHILCWYPKNVDAFRLSGYFFKERNGPISMGPVWDYDRTMGCSDDDRARDPEGWDNLLSSGDGGTRYFQSGDLGSWYSLLFNNRPPTTDTPWNRAYKARWIELRKGPLRTEHILGQIDKWAEELRPTADRSVRRWPEMNPRFGSLQGEIDHLKDWLAKRADWIDAQFIEAPHFDPPAGKVARGTQVQILMTAQTTIYYTTDGSDPEGTGGTPGATAVAYAGPIAIQANTRLHARARYPDGYWSSLIESVYITDIPPLTITEIMYKPLPGNAQEDPTSQFSATHMEFVEITNVGTQPVPLAGIKFTKGITFTFDGVAVPALDPLASVVIPRSKAAFQARYGTQGTLIAGEYGGLLTDNGESIALAGTFGESIFDFRFGGTWYEPANGGGYSIVNVDPAGPSDGLGDAARWRASDAVNGSPGRVEGSGGGGRLLPGDTNRDGKLHVTDSIRTLLMLFGGLQDGPCGSGLETTGNKKLLDWDGNSVVNVTDALLGLQYLFQNGPPHAAGVACVLVEGCNDACVR